MFKPMLAAEADESKLQFPLLASPKLDGIRASVVGGQLLTRSLKQVPNDYLFESLSLDTLNGLDGELIVGAPNAPTVYRDTVKGVMSHDGKPNATYWVFDLHDHDAHYEGRYDQLTKLHGVFQKRCKIPIKVLPQTLIRSLDDLAAFETATVDDGYEGVILRKPQSPYKFGRSTAREGYLLKLKRFKDSEALIIGVEEEMFNGNEAQINELGRTKRSTAKAGLVPKGRMGTLHVRDIHTGVDFHIGTGFDDGDKAAFWEHREKHTSKTIVKYKFFPVGVKDKPRHPVFLGVRSGFDL